MILKIIVKLIFISWLAFIFYSFIEEDKTMTLHDAIVAVKDSNELYFRPESWRGTGAAYLVKNDSIVFFSNGIIFSCFDADVGDILGEWQIIKHDDLMKEGK